MLCVIFPPKRKITQVYPILPLRYNVEGQDCRTSLEVERSHELRPHELFLSIFFVSYLKYNLTKKACTLSTTTVHPPRLIVHSPSSYYRMVDGLLPTLRAIYGFKLNPAISVIVGTIKCNFFNGLPINLPLDVNRPSDVQPLPL
jgi:hypothetical protein